MEYMECPLTVYPTGQQHAGADVQRRLHTVGRTWTRILMSPCRLKISQCRISPAAGLLVFLVLKGKKKLSKDISRGLIGGLKKFLWIVLLMLNANYLQSLSWLL